MRIHQEELRHPTQASRVRLRVYEMSEPPAPVHGMEALLDGGRHVVTEDRIGTTTVVATLGSYPNREAALARVKERVKELEAQQWVPAPPSA